jgi:hypothetical protein
MKTLLNTTIKEESQNANTGLKMPAFAIYHLENEAELTVLIREAEQTLLPCANCGRIRLRIEYCYVPRSFDHRNPDGRHPHELYVYSRIQIETAIVCQ